VRVRVIDIRDHSVKELDLSTGSRDMSGWQSGVLGWSLGQKGSGSPIELDEPLGECHVGVFEVTYQVLLWGRARELPEVWLFPQTKPTTQLVPFVPEQWLRLDREELKRVSMGGDIRLRFDQSPVRFGNYILESLKGIEPARDCCAFCNELLHTYFRVGSQQACPACTEKFKQKMQADLARRYRRALAIGIVVAIAGGAIHALLLSAAGVSFGSVLIGILVGMAMRMASRESAGSRYRVTAGILTFVAGSLPLWGRFLAFDTPWTTGMFMSTVYLAMGVFAAWTVAARNVRTEIHGPFQANHKLTNQ
jgi:hypothetical protein